MKNLIIFLLVLCLDFTLWAVDIDFNKPAIDGVTTISTNFECLRTNEIYSLKQDKSITASNLPTGTMAWDKTTGFLYQYSGSTWEIFQVNFGDSMEVSGEISLLEVAAEPNQKTGYIKIYAMTDHKIYYRIPDGTTAEIGGGDFSNGGEAGGDNRSLGNTDAFDLSFLTSGETRLQISESGTVGIGTTSGPGTLSLKTAGSNNCTLYFQDGTTGGGNSDGVNLNVDSAGVLTINLSETGADLSVKNGSNQLLFADSSRLFGVNTATPNFTGTFYQPTAGNYNCAIQTITNATGSTANDGVYMAAMYDGTARLFNQETGDLALGTNKATEELITSTGVSVNKGFVGNEDSGDYDSRIESNDDANMFYVDAGNNRIGLKTSAPDATFHIVSADAGTPSIPAGNIMRLEGSSVVLDLFTPNSGEPQIIFSDPENFLGQIGYIHSTDLMYIKASAEIDLYTGDSLSMTLEKDGDVNVSKGKFRAPYSGPILGAGAESAAYIDTNGGADSGEIRYDTSSKKFKTNIKDIAEMDITKFQPVEYDRVDSGAHDIGLIAEDVAKINPLLCTYDANGDVLGIRYQLLPVALIKPLQATIEQVKDLNRDNLVKDVKLDLLQSKLDQLEAEIVELKKQKSGGDL